MDYLVRIQENIINYKNKNENNNFWVPLSIHSSTCFENFHVYEKPKEKVQYYQAMYREHFCTVSYITTRVFKDENHFKEEYKNCELIQLAKFGEPV